MATTNLHITLFLTPAKSTKPKITPECQLKGNDYFS